MTAHNIRDLPALERDLRAVLNTHSVENGSNTPDYVLAEYLIGCLLAFVEATKLRSKHYNSDIRKSASDEIETRKRDNVVSL